MKHLAASHNFRDLGGWSAANGRQVRHGLLFRSAALAGMADEELQELDSLGIRLVVDLRSPEERRHTPSTHSIATWAREQEESMADLQTLWSRPGLDAAQLTAMMVDVYCALPDEQAASYAELFRRIAAGDLPILFHCAAGKDRTGVAAALLLDLLGVPRALIEDDYLRTRATVVRAVAETKKVMAALGAGMIDDATLAPVLGVDALYLEAMFVTIKRRHGSTEHYVKTQLKLDATEIDSIRAQMLQ